MKMRVLTTMRQIRALMTQQEDGMVGKILPIGEFFSKAIVVPGKRLVDRDLAKLFLYEAMERVDLGKLGIAKEFGALLKQADTIFDFWKEVFKEGVRLEEIELGDIYAEYPEHLALLEALRKEYRAILEREGFADPAMLEEFVINEAFFHGVDRVEMEVAGYLSAFERSVLEQLPAEVELRFVVSRFNRPLIAKMFGQLDEGVYRYDFKRRLVLEQRELTGFGDVEVAAFSDPIHQVHYVFASIQELVAAGCDPERIAVILPDEGRSELLRIFNDGNLNFAMGTSMRQSAIYLLLQSLYDYLAEGDEVALKRIAASLEEFEQSEMIEFIKAKASERELVVLDEELHKIERLLPYVGDDRVRQLHFILQRLSTLSMDDTDGGKVTVMGVLEARGMEFDGAVIVDFNEGVVPKIGQSDLFLNSAVRARAGLPTKKEKEALQKHYYHEILRRSRFVRIAYVSNEEESPSRFLYELGLGEGKDRSSRYEQVCYRFTPDPTPTTYDGIIFEVPKILTPSTFQLLLECPKRYYFERVLELKNEEEEPLSFGNRFHEVMEQLLKPKPRFSSPKEYSAKVMEGLLAGCSKYERFEIESRWREKVEWFCAKDFERLGGSYAIETFGEHVQLGGYTLTAKFDRLDSEAVIDYKTGNYKAADYFQGLFYNYIYKKPAIFYYIKEKRVRIVDEEDAAKQLEEHLKKIEGITRESIDEKVCRWCPYRFMCNQTV